MVRTTWVPGAVTAGSNIDLPANSPPIDGVISAEIIRVPGALANHAAHSHDLAIVGGQAAGVAIQFTPDTDAGIVGKTTATTRTLPGPANSGIQNAAAMAHAGASPVVTATPTKVDENTITLNVNTALGDLLTLSYVQVGERVKVS